MNFEEFKTEFLKWTEEKVEAKKSDGFTVCPFARRARLKNKIQFLDVREDLSKLDDFDQETYEIAIAWLGDNTDIELIDKTLDGYRERHPELLYFTSTPHSGEFVQNFTDCVFVQLKGDILEKREYLHTTDYYKSWPTAYYKMIMES